MKFIIERDILFKYLKYINGIINKNDVSSDRINIKIKKDNIIIKCFNYEIEINLTINIILCNNNYNNNIICISYKKIFNICKNIDKKANIEFIIKNNYLLIKNKNTIFYILIYKKNNNFIINKEKKNIISLSINKNSLIYIINKIYISIANNDIRNYLNYVLFEIIKENLILTSTDGYRLTNCKMKILNTNIKINFLISKKTINNLNKILLYNDDNDIINIFIYNKYFYIKLNNISFFSLLYKDKFPNYNDIIDEKRKYILHINKNNIIKSINKIISISDEINSILRFIINKNNIIIKLMNSKNEVSKEILESNINYEINNYEIGINPIYITSILNKIDSEYINIHFSNKNSSIKIEDINNKNSVYIIMPIKI